MTLVTAVVACIGCSLCNGISTVQQKVGADEVASVHTFNLLLFWKLLRNIPYTLGVLIAIAGYGLSLIALRILPLFLVQSLIAASVLVTAFGEHVFLHKHFGKQTYWSLAIVLTGLILISIGAVSGPATVHDQTSRFLVEICPIPLGILGAILVYNRSKLSAFVLAALGGLLFGNTSTIGRILVYPHPVWKIIENPLVGSLVVSSLLAQYFFTVSLQRTLATKSNAIMISMQTLGPAVYGLLFFDDRIRSGFQLVVLFGSLLVIAGSAATAVDETPTATI